jgi:hypothetical protein
MMSNRMRGATQEDRHGREHKCVDACNPADAGPDPPPSGWMPQDLITEAEAYAAFGHVLEDKELRHARQSGRLGFMRRKRTIFYRRDELEAFVSSLLRQDYVEPCKTRMEPLPKGSRRDGSLFVTQRASQNTLPPDLLRQALKMME